MTNNNNNKLEWSDSKIKDRSIATEAWVRDLEDGKRLHVEYSVTHHSSRKAFLVRITKAELGETSGVTFRTVKITDGIRTIDRVPVARYSEKRLREVFETHRARSTELASQWVSE